MLCHGRLSQPLFAPKPPNPGARKDLLSPFSRGISSAFRVARIECGFCGHGDLILYKLNRFTNYPHTSVNTFTRMFPSACGLLGPLCHLCAHETGS
ncbi:hypothetical protein BN1012_Phect584 [Candidatus Phaeomarinobacter ectocarpi]|uniref:Uncharacterized protein n=1 Tax=Candidatus Phaeomarinibacter ectocarpi TaxID=1458461 RepID=X5M6V7_9HYPH|nr:hypothetical protein BN1012_Phect584 [Candidatus Phaeomarinobacter ectocarpi]